MAHDSLKNVEHLDQGCQAQLQKSANMQNLVDKGQFLSRFIE